MNAHSLEDNAAISATLKILSGKWKIMILFALCSGKKRFNELRRIMPDVTQRMLTVQLRELERDQIIIRKVYREVPPKVEYFLSTIGKSLTPILIELKQWGADYHKKVGMMNKLNSHVTDSNDH